MPQAGQPPDGAQRVLPALLLLLFCVLLTAISRGAGETFSVFLLPLSQHFGWERAAVASVYSVYMVSLGVGSLLAGLVFDRLGARFCYLLGTSMLAVTYGLAGSLQSLWQFYLLPGVCGGIGAAMLGIIPAQSLVSRWFDKRLSLAMSIAYAGQGLGQLALVPLAQLAITVLPVAHTTIHAKPNPARPRAARVSQKPSKPDPSGVFSAYSPSLPSAFLASACRAWHT